MGTNERFYKIKVRGIVIHPTLINSQTNLENFLAEYHWKHCYRFLSMCGA